MSPPSCAAPTNPSRLAGAFLERQPVVDKRADWRLSNHRSHNNNHRLVPTNELGGEYLALIGGLRLERAPACAPLFEPSLAPMIPDKKSLSCAFFALHKLHSRKTEKIKSAKRAGLAYSFRFRLVRSLRTIQIQFIANSSGQLKRANMRDAAYPGRASSKINADIISRHYRASSLV